ncbi:MAG: UvrB/UvrC motif-containing protein, partial [Candidatus Cloacimonadota bacterium]|nr:UvrB/UvrC motif-containing protein [Candidatus Cloacimonadota bacterium]
STSIAEGYTAKTTKKKSKKKAQDEFEKYLDLDTPEKVMQLLEDEMRQAAEELNFEKAAQLRDRLLAMKQLNKA